MQGNNNDESNNVKEGDSNSNDIYSQEMAAKLSSEIIEKLQSLGNLDETKAYLTQTLLDIQKATAKKSQDQSQKLQDEKTILIKAFAKQREKIQDLQEKNESLATLLTNRELENQRLREVNYNLGLRMKILDPRENEQDKSDII